MKVYLLSSGSYSDYTIEAIYADKAKAEKVREFYGEDYNDIEEFELDPDDDIYLKDYNKTNLRRFGFRINEEGKIQQLWPANFGEVNDKKSEYEIVTRSKEIGNGEEGVLEGYLYAKSKGHVIKIINDKRRELIALNKWVVGEVK